MSGRKKKQRRQKKNSDVIQRVTVEPVLDSNGLLIELTGYYPPSVNHCYVTTVIRGKLRRFPSSEYNEFKRVMREAIEPLQFKLLKKPLRLFIVLSYTDNRARDIDNPLKALLDSMSGVVYEDDGQIIYLEVKKVHQKIDGGVTVLVTEVND